MAAYLCQAYLTCPLSLQAHKQQGGRSEFDQLMRCMSWDVRLRHDHTPVLHIYKADSVDNAVLSFLSFCDSFEPLGCIRRYHHDSTKPLDPGACPVSGMRPAGGLPLLYATKYCKCAEMPGAATCHL